MAKIRADHVGSLLRPKVLLDARRERERGAIGPEQLATAEDQAIHAVLRRQQSAGVEVFSDGEFRRTSWLGGLYDAAVGLVAGEPRQMARMWNGPGADQANEDLPIPALAAARPIELKGRITGEETRFLGRFSPGPFKITMPGPTMYLGLRQPGVSDKAYPDPRSLLEHLVAIYQAEVEAQVADGAAYVQLDSLRYTHVIGNRTDMLRDTTVEQALDEAVESDNAVLARAKAKGAITAIHMCRGNHRSAWAAVGSYDSVAEYLFARTQADRLLLEFDDERSGGFEPLRFVRKGTTVVLGLITTKTPQLEDPDVLRRRIDEAAKYVDLDDLALSPQCGFASTYLGNLLTEDDEKRKLELVAETARAVWG